MKLEELGWTSFFAAYFADFEESQSVVARVARKDGQRYSLLGESGAFSGEVAGKMRCESYMKLKRELEYLASREDTALQLSAKERDKQFARRHKAVKKAQKRAARGRF